MVQAVLRTMEFPQLQFIDKVIDVPVCSLGDVVGPCAQAQGQGLTPAISAGKGWRGRWELAPRRSATQLGACSLWFIDRDLPYTLRPAPQPPHRFKQVAFLYV